METAHVETGWDSAPGLIEGATTLELTPELCNIEYWLDAVAQGTLRGLVRGHRPEAATPEYMCRPGPLRDALIIELGFRAAAEEKATRAISGLVELAPDIACMEFYATQLIDEARHARVFRGHVVEMGIPETELFATIDEYAGKDIEQILNPLEDFARTIRADNDFIGGVIMLTILVEGVLAPTAEMSERKWRPLDPAAADIERGAGIDEIRHLAVGSAIVKRYVQDNPAERGRLAALLGQGQQIWGTLPVLDMMGRREALFQDGLAEQAAVVGGYEVWPGRRLVDTSPAERMHQAVTWATEMQQSRLTYMGLAG